MPKRPIVRLKGSREVFIASSRSVSFACLDCRVSFKKPSVDLTGDPEAARFPCPNCRKRMRYMGRSFHAPRRNATRQWRKVTLLIQHGYRFESMWADPLPKTMNDLRNMLKHETTNSLNMRKERREQLLLEQRAARIGETRRKPKAKRQR